LPSLSRRKSTVLFPAAVVGKKKALCFFLNLPD
jgi:hypothetical protein